MNINGFASREIEKNTRRRVLRSFSRCATSSSLWIYRFNDVDVGISICFAN